MTLLDDRSSDREQPVVIGLSRPDPTGPTRIPTDRYISPAWMEREAEHLWPRVWQIACSTDHVARPGDVYEYRAGWLSVIVVRGHDGQLRAFQNACPHRGNAICDGSATGLTEIRCPFHRWAWDTTGAIREIPSRKWFGTVADDDVALIPALVDTLGPMVFVNLDVDAVPLLEWLEGVPHDLQSAGVPLDDFRCNSLVLQELPANWKVVAEGFSETYHVQGVHPEMLGHLDDVHAPQRIWNRHGVSYQQYGVPSPRLGRDVADHVVWSSWIESMGSRLGVSESSGLPCPEVPAGATIRDAIADGIKAHQASLGVDLSALDTAQTTAATQYNLFPNASFLVWSDMINVLSSRPGLTPDSCQFVSMNFHRVPPGAPAGEPFTGELPAGTDLGLVLGQDVGIMRTAQRGLHQPGLTHLLVSDEECRVINLNRNLDDWLGIP